MSTVWNDAAELVRGDRRRYALLASHHFGAVGRSHPAEVRSLVNRYLVCQARALKRMWCTQVSQHPGGRVISNVLIKGKKNLCCLQCGFARQFLNGQEATAAKVVGSQAS